MITVELLPLDEMKQIYDQLHLKIVCLEVEKVFSGWTLTKDFDNKIYEWTLSLLVFFRKNEAEKVNFARKTAREKLGGKIWAVKAGR